MLTYFELQARCHRALMRSYALGWRAARIDPYPTENTIRVNLECARDYRQIAANYQRMADREREEREWREKEAELTRAAAEIICEMSG